MSTRTYPAAHATLTRSDSIDAPPGTTIQHRGQQLEIRTVHLRLFAGYASDGYQTDYQRRPVQWLEIEATTPDGKRVRRECSRFAGANIENATRKYDQACTDFAKRWPGAVATFPTGPDAKPYRAPCWTCNGTDGAECGRANVQTTTDKAAVNCPECLAMMPAHTPGPFQNIPSPAPCAEAPELFDEATGPTPDRGRVQTADGHSFNCSDHGLGTY